MSSGPVTATPEMVAAAYAAYEDDEVLKRAENWLEAVINAALAARPGVAQNSQEQGCGDPNCTDPNCDYGKNDDALHAEVRRLRAALETAAGRFNMMAGVGLVNGADPKIGYRECMAVLSDTSTDRPAPMTAKERWCAANVISHDDPTVSDASPEGK